MPNSHDCLDVLIWTLSNHAVDVKTSYLVTGFGQVKLSLNSVLNNAVISSVDRWSNCAIGSSPVYAKWMIISSIGKSISATVIVRSASRTSVDVAVSEFTNDLKYVLAAAMTTPWTLTLQSWPINTVSHRYSSFWNWSRFWRKLGDWFDCSKQKWTMHYTSLEAA